MDTQTVVSLVGFEPITWAQRRQRGDVKICNNIVMLLKGMCDIKTENNAPFPSLHILQKQKLQIIGNT